MRRIPLVAAALILSLSAPVFAQEWAEYVSRGDLFAVNFPKQPTVSEITYESEYGITVPGRVYSVEDGGSRYSVAVIDFTSVGPKHAEKLKACRAGEGEGDQCMDRAYLEAGRDAELVERARNLVTAIHAARSSVPSPPIRAP